MSDFLSICIIVVHTTKESWSALAYFFGGMNHNDNNGHKVGESRPGFFGGLNHYDDKGHKQGHSNPGFLGGFNHYG